MATAVAQMATAALQALRARRGSAAVPPPPRARPVSRPPLRPPAGRVRDEALDVATRGWRMGEGSGGAVDETEGNGDGARPASGWANGGARARGRGASNRSGGSRERRAPPSRRYADDERGDHGDWFDDDGFDRGRGARGGRGGGGADRGRNRGSPGRPGASTTLRYGANATTAPPTAPEPGGRRATTRRRPLAARGDPPSRSAFAAKPCSAATRPPPAVVAAGKIWGCGSGGIRRLRDRALLKAVEARGITPEYASKAT